MYLLAQQWVRRAYIRNMKCTVHDLEVMCLEVMCLDPVQDVHRVHSSSFMSYLTPKYLKLTGVNFVYLSFPPSSN